MCAKSLSHVASQGSDPVRLTPDEIWRRAPLWLVKARPQEPEGLGRCQKGNPQSLPTYLPKIHNSSLCQRWYAVIGAHFKFRAVNLSSKRLLECDSARSSNNGKPVTPLGKYFRAVECDVNKSGISNWPRRVREYLPTYLRYLR